PAYLAAPQGHVLRSAPPPTSTTLPSAAPVAVAVPPIPTQWVLMGDSVAASLAPALQASAASDGIQVFSFTRPGCGMISAPAVNEDGSTIPWAAGCANTTASYQQEALRSSGAQVVLWLSGWESADHRFNGQWLPIGTPQGDAALVGEIEASVDRLAASGA